MATNAMYLTEGSGHLSTIPFGRGIAFFACSYVAICYILCPQRGSAVHSLSMSAYSRGKS